MSDKARNHHCKIHPIGFDLCDMDMDLDISRWVLEFLFRNVMDDSFVKKVLFSLPLPDNSPRLKKTLLLRSLYSETLDGSVSVKMLDFLETIALLDRQDGYVIVDTLKSAYCAVAVDCTLRFAEETGNEVGQYFDAVKRIWRERIESLEKDDSVDLMSDQLRSWKDDIEAALYDDQLCKKLIAMNTRKEAIKAVRVYVTEAWKLMGPTFLELVSKKMGRSLMEAQKLSDPERGSLVEEGSPSLSNVRRSLGFCDKANMVDENCVGEKATSTQIVGNKCLMEDETQAGGGTISGDIGGSSKPVAINENVVGNVEAPGHTVDGNLGVVDHVLERVEGIVNPLTSGSMELVDSDEPTKRHNAQVLETAANSPIASDGVGAYNQCGDEATCFQGHGGRSMSAVQVENRPDETAMQLNNAQKKLGGTDQLNDARDKDADEDRNAMEISAPASRHREVENKKVLLKRKNVVGNGKRLRRGVRIGDVEELSSETSRGRFGLLCSAEVNKVQNALRSSSLELHAAVKDPLPEALKLADAVISGMGREQINANPPVETQDRIDVDVPIHSVGGNVEAIQANENNIPDLICRHKKDDPRSSSRDESHVDASVPNPFGSKDSGVGVVQGSGDNHGTRHSSHQINEARASLMDRNGTAQTYKWDDSIDDSSPSRRTRLHLESPKRRAVSPLKKYESPTKLCRRRAIKRWSTEEEDTLRTGVLKFGRGNWKIILFTYRHIFQGRTEVDLKDKWRNLMK